MIHLAHFLDGYPLCWPQDKEGEFDASQDEAAITCPDCLRYMKEKS